MGYISARSSFENAKSKTNDLAIQELAEGLRQLARAVEDDIKKLQQAVKR
jgi:hypothetical protein